MKKLSLQTWLLTLFLSTTLTAIFMVFYFSYHTQNQLFQKFYSDLVNKSEALLHLQIEDLLLDFENTTKTGADLFANHIDMTVANKEMIRFFLSEIKDNPSIHSSFLVEPKGGYLFAFPLQKGKNPFPENQIPLNATYCVILSNGSSKASALFYDTNAKFLQSIPSTTNISPLTRPWYQESLQKKDFFWTNLYTFSYPENVEGISSCMPIYDETQKLKAIIGLDLSSSLFSEIIQKGKFSEHSITLIMSDDDHVIFTNSSLQKDNNLLGQAALQAAKESNNQTNPFIFRFKGQLYFGKLSSFPPSFQNPWQMILLIPRSDFSAKILFEEKFSFIASSTVVVLTAFLLLFFAHSVARPITELSKEIADMTHLKLESEERRRSFVKEIDQMEQAINSMRIALRSFARYIPSEIAKELMQKENDIHLGGEKKVLTLFFTDIANFTSIAEKLPIEKVNELLARHFDALSQVILDCGGVIDKYMGDGIMSLWGILHEENVHKAAINACKAALLCQLRLKSLNEKQSAQGFSEFITRMGLNTGSVIVGNFGTSKRMNYSVLGDAVNIASRLEGLNKQFGTKILIGEETAALISPHFLIRLLDTVEVRGKTEKTKIYELIAAFHDDPRIAPTPEEFELAESFSKAIDLFHRNQKEEAETLLTKIHDRFPKDIPTQIYLEKLKT